MSDQPLSPDHELASAYLDGLASAPERAQVEASPELIALVRSFRELRASLAAGPTPSDTVRESAFAAALAEFDALGAAGPGASPQVAAIAAVPPVAPPSNVVSIDRHRRWNRMLGAAAAVAVIGLAGVAVANLGSGSSSDSSSAATDFAEAADTMSGTGDSSKVGIAGNVTDPSNLPPTGTDQAPVRNTTDTNSGGTDTTAGSIASIDGGGSAVPALQSTESLRALPEPKTGVSPSFVFECPLSSDQEIVLEITWKGTPAVVVRDTVTGVITVLDAQCDTLVTVAN
jgi:hypothetical protein